ncbi:MAG: hypothetical protein GWP03_06700, partial [Proteobacteria bacterium]|nr:hypothetical protein [Pseudomonadota bacterium]
NEMIGYIKTPDSERLLPRVYFSLFKQPLIGKITYLEDGEISILIGINPLSLDKWNNIDLTKLAKKLSEKNSAFDFSSRKNVIRTRFRGDLSALYKTLVDINMEEFYDDKELFTICK